MQRLSIPLVKGKHQQTPVREVRISYDEPWQQVHWRSICTAYGNAPYFEHYADELEVFFQKKYTFLFDLNRALLDFLIQKINWPGEIRLTEHYQIPGEQRGQTGGIPPAITDFRDAVMPKPGASTDWFQPAPYPQVFMERHGFLPDLSALDLLFCCGKQGGGVLQSSFS